MSYENGRVPVFLYQREPVDTPFNDDDGWRNDYEIAPFQLLFNTDRRNDPNYRNTRCGRSGSFRTVRVPITNENL